MHDTPAQLEDAVTLLRRGGLVAFSTETVYGLGARAFDAEAVARVFQAKQRPASNPLIVHVASVSMAREVCDSWPRDAESLAEAFWPGPLSIVVMRGKRIPPIVTAGGPTVCVRMPAHPLALALIEALGEPIVGPSANRSGHISPTTALHVLHEFPAMFVLDGGPCRVGIESTVIDVTTNPPTLLRPGTIVKAQIEEVIGDCVRMHPVLNVEEHVSRSPGLMQRHYAPRTPTRLCNDWTVCDTTAKRYVLLTQRARELPEHVNAIAMPTDAEAYAAMMYDALRRADSMGADLIIIERPSGGGDPGVWSAIVNRLERAADQDGQE